MASLGIPLLPQREQRVQQDSLFPVPGKCWMLARYQSQALLILPLVRSTISWPMLRLEKTLP